MAYPGSLGATSDALNDYYNIGKYKPKPKPVVDPTKQSNSQIAALLASIAQGPDYSGVNLDPYGAADVSAQGQGYKDARGMVEARIDAKLQPFKDSYTSDKALLDSQRKLSTDASNNFNAAFAGILTGGKAGAEGQAYAKDHFGGSYMGDIAAEDGMLMLGQITRDFNARDWELKDKLDKVLAQRPDLVDQLYQDVVNTEVENAKNGITMAESSWDHRFKAATLITNILQKQEAAAAKVEAARIAAKAKVDAAALTGVAVNTTVVRTGNVARLIDESTGQVIATYKGPAAATKAAKETIYGNSTSGYYRIQGGKMVPVPGYKPPVAGSSGGTTADGAPAQPRTTPAAITKIGKRQVDDVVDNIAKRFDSGAAEGTPEFAREHAAYKAWLASGKSFGTAMSRVINAIGPSLRKTGYNSAQVKEAAYRIVAAEMDPPKGYKVPSAKPVSYKMAATPAVGATKIAATQIGKPYLFGSGPNDNAYDCSELIQYSYGKMGIKLARDTYGQIKNGRPVNYRSIDDLLPGDLIFPTTHHVVMYVGDGKMIAAPHTGALVQYQNLSDFGQPVAVRRIVEGGMGVGTV